MSDDQLNGPCPNGACPWDLRSHIPTAGLHTAFLRCPHPLDDPAIQRSRRRYVASTPTPTAWDPILSREIL